MHFMAAPTIDHTIGEILDLADSHFKVPREKLTADDDFFRTLGIDSLQALALLTRLEQHFRIQLPAYELQGVPAPPPRGNGIRARLYPQDQPRPIQPPRSTTGPQARRWREHSVCS